MQNGLLEAQPGIHDEARLVDVIVGLQRRARAADAPVVFLRHDGGPRSATPRDTPAWAINARVAPTDAELVIEKRSCDGFQGTDLDATLRALGVRHLVVTGIVSELCVDSTCRRAITLGYDVTLVADGHSTDAGGPPNFPPAEMRIKLENHTLAHAWNFDRAIEVSPSTTIEFG
jgi:nicotinamidase-related amidase